MYVHGDNIAQKMSGGRKYNDAISRQYLNEIQERYLLWRAANEQLTGPFEESTDDDYSIIQERTRLFNEYKDFIDQQHYAEHFDSRSNLHSSVLEEFIYYLFRDLVADFSDSALIGKSHAFKDIFFMANNYEEMVSAPSAHIEIKDHDFVIGASINATFQCAGATQAEHHELQIPAVAIECKTYLDKTMLEGASTAGAQLKARNPNAIYIVVAERLKLTNDVNMKKYQVDEVYILRKQKNTDREDRYLPGYQSNPIYPDVVAHLFEMVRDHLTRDWEAGISHGLENGYLVQNTPSRMYMSVEFPE